MKNIWIFLLILGIFLFACNPSFKKELPEYNILLIVSDALRADALGCYGGQADTPHIDRLAEQGVLFENAYSNAPWTLPSSVAIFSGNYPSTYGQSVGKVIDSVVEKMFYIINENEFLLAEELAARGFDTLYSFENDISKRSNILQGLDDLAERVVLDTAQEQAVIESLGLEGAVAPARYRKNIPLMHYIKHTENPFFIVKWIADPHSAYSPPHKFRKKIEVDAAKLTRDIDFYERLGAANPNIGIHDIQEIGPTLNEHELQYVKQLYLKEIESVDERIGQILSALESNPDFEKTIVVLTSDHGEGFWEHGLFEHGNSLYNELLKIALILYAPGRLQAGARVGDVVSMVDVLPTILDLTGIEAPQDLRGQSLLPSMEGNTDGGKFAYSEFPHKKDIYLAYSIQSRSYKIIFGQNDTEKRMRFELDKDSLELRSVEWPDLSQEGPLMDELIRIRNAASKHRLGKESNLEEPSKETLERLRSLGYIK